MTEDKEAGALAELAARERDRAAHARLLAKDITDPTAKEGLLSFADELEQKAQELEARAAVLRQSAHETQADIEQDIAAFKPPEPEKDA